MFGVLFWGLFPKYLAIKLSNKRYCFHLSRIQKSFKEKKFEKNEKKFFYFFFPKFKKILLFFFSKIQNFFLSLFLIDKHVYSLFFFPKNFLLNKKKILKKQ
jgi:hypothetical protein